MAQQYAFRCNACDRTFGITVKNAGASVDCPFCEHANTLPRLREIQALPVFEQPDQAGGRAGAGRSSSNRSLASMLFAIGLLVAVVAGAGGILLTRYANGLTSESKTQERIEFARQQADNASPALLWDVWDKMSSEGLPDWQESPAVRYNKQAKYLKQIAYGIFTVAALGLLAMLGSFMLRRA